MDFGADRILRRAARRAAAGARDRSRLQPTAIPAAAAYWLAEIAFRVAGLFGVYVARPVCVIATYWCVFALSRAIVGGTHAVSRCC